MKTLKEAIGNLDPAACAARWKQIKHEERRMKASGRRAYLFPGMAFYPRPSERVGREAALDPLLVRSRVPPRWVLALPEWKAWEAAPGDTAAYVALFCRMNHLKL